MKPLKLTAGSFEKFHKLGRGLFYPLSWQILTQTPPFSSVRHNTHLLPTMLCQHCLTITSLETDLFPDKFMISSNFMMCLSGYALSYIRHMFNFLFWHLPCQVCAWSRNNFVSLQHSSLTFVPLGSVTCSPPNKTPPPSTSSQTYTRDFLSRRMDWVFTFHCFSHDLPQQLCSIL